MSTDRISNNIRRFRLDRGQMTQQQLADKANVTRQTIIAVEQGRYSPSLSLAFRIANALNTKIEDVFKYNPND